MNDRRGWYDFTRPEDVARYLQSLLWVEQQRQWWRLFWEEKGAAFMEQVKQYVVGFQHGQEADQENREEASQ